jgi:phosphoglycolate phosphatase
VPEYVSARHTPANAIENTSSYEQYPMKRIKVIIFDCDGVMFDSRQANINYYNQIRAKFDLSPMTADQVDFVHMHTADASVRHIFTGTPYFEQAQAYRKKVDYTPFIKDMIMAPGLPGLLERLKPHYGLAVATNRGDTIGEVLVLNGLAGFFDIVISSLDVQHPKPHPESVFKILNFFRISSDEAIYVGDSLVDEQTARGAGVTLISYQNPALDTVWQADRLSDIEKILQAITAPPPEVQQEPAQRLR